MRRVVAFAVFALAVGTLSVVAGEGLLAGFLGAVRTATGGAALPAVHVPVLGFVLVAAGVLLWLRPRTLPYTLGLLCLLLSLVGFWLASPDGGRWVAALLFRDSAPGLYDRRWAGWLSFLLFPAAWHLLAASIATWRVGLVAYLLAGLAFVLMGAAAGFFRAPATAGIVLLFWPQQVLTMLGVFGALAFS